MEEEGHPRLLLQVLAIIRVIITAEGVWWDIPAFTGQSLKAQIAANRKLKETPGGGGSSGPGAPAKGPKVGGDMMEQIRKKAEERNKKMQQAEASASTNDQITQNDT